MFDLDRSRQPRLQLPFTLLALTIIVVMTLGAVTLIWQARNAALAEAHAVYRGTAKALSRHVFHIIRSSEVLLDQAEAELERQGGIEAAKQHQLALHNALKQLVQPLPEINTALIADGNGKLMATNQTPQAPDVNYTDRPWFQAHKAGRDLVIGEPVTGRTSNRPIITISRAIRDRNGAIQAIALVGVEISYLEQLFADAHTDQGRAAALFIDDGTLIARNPPETPGKRYPNAITLGLARVNPSGSAIMVGTAVDGRTRLNAWDKVSDYPLVVVAGQIMDKLLEPWRAFALQVAALTAGMLVVVIICARFALQSVRREEAAMVAAENSARELARSNESLESVLAAAPEGIIGVGSDECTMFVNDAALRLTGFAREDLIGKSLHMTIHHHHADNSPYPAEDCAMHNGLLDASLCTVADEVFWRKDGSTFPVEYTAGRLDMPDGQFGCVVVFRDISSRRRMEEELKRSNADLEQFAYAVSHDLQEPLRTISGFVGLLKRGYRDKLPDEAIEFIDMAVGGVKRMSGMIDDLLAYSRIGRADIQPTPVDLTACATSARQSLQAAIADTGASVEISRLPTVPGIDSQLVSLFQNLLGNAVKYAATVRSPVVTVGAQREGRSWVIRITDNGMGIPAPDRDRVFQVFQRLHHRGISGSGVGLALCRRIVERHGGSIWIESRTDDNPGSVFAFRLPAE